MTYTFLVPTDSSDSVIRYFAIPEDKLETLRASKTYDQFGQEVGTYNAGDSIQLNTQKAQDLANKIAQEQDEDYAFGIGDIINGYDHADIFDLIEAAFDNAGLKDGEDYDLICETCTGFDYHDGNNWRTVVVSYENLGHPSYSVLDDEDLTQELNSAIEEMEGGKEQGGARVYQGGKYQITESFWQGHWESYELNPLDEIVEY